MLRTAIEQQRGHQTAAHSGTVALRQHCVRAPRSLRAARTHPDFSCLLCMGLAFTPNQRAERCTTVTACIVQAMGRVLLRACPPNT